MVITAFALFAHAKRADHFGQLPGLGFAAFRVIAPNFLLRHFDPIKRAFLGAPHRALTEPVLGFGDTFDLDTIMLVLSWHDAI